MLPARGTLTLIVGVTPAGDVEGGEWVTGGGSDLLAFTSSRQAVRWALEHADDGLGVHAGEVEIDDGAVVGRAVGVATRVAAAAGAGEVLVSTIVRELSDDDELAFGPAQAIEQGIVVHAVRSRAAPLRLVLADDHTIVRDGLAALLAAAGQTVAGTASDGTEVLSVVNRQRPDVVVLDIRMPPTHTDEGLAAAERIRAEHPEIGVLVLSQYVEPTLALRLLEAAPDGGVGYLLKDRVSNMELLLDALRRIDAGETVIDPSIADRLARLGTVDELTGRELEVLSLIAQGRSNRAIADLLFVERKTVESHISQIFLKLDLRDTADEHRRVAAVLAFLGHPR